MLNEYFGFERKPFSNTPDPRFLYLSRRHHEALARWRSGSWAC
jgi:general secretion pathway protein A